MSACCARSVWGHCSSQTKTALNFEHCPPRDACPFSKCFAVLQFHDRFVQGFPVPKVFAGHHHFSFSAKDTGMHIAELSLSEMSPTIAAETTGKE